MSDRSDAIGAELLALRDENGLINAQGAVQWARSNCQSHLHAALVWDDAIAGERYRVWQVRQLISVNIVDAHGDRQFVSLSVDRASGGYRPIADVMSQAELRDIMVSDALADLEKMEKRYQKLTELSRIWVEAGKVRGNRVRRSRVRAA